MSQKQTRVLIAEDHMITAHGIQMILLHQSKLDVVAVAKDGKMAVQLYREHSPDIAILDISMPTMNGIETLKQIMGLDPKAKIIILSAHDQEEWIFQAFQNGAKAYLAKNTIVESLIGTIDRVFKGEKVLEGDVAIKYLQRSFKPALSPREIQVLKLVAEGNSNALIAQELHLSEGTVKIHIHNIFKKMNVSDRTNAVVEAIKQGIIEV